MSERSADRLYELLPAIYRIRDVELGEPLRALLEIIGAEVATLEADIDRLYDNWFIETCDEWVVPYLGDLLGLRGIIPVAGGGFSQRALVANTLAHRRGKGTAATLEQLARDVTGWPAKVVELFQLLATSQHLNHVRPGNHVTLDLRDSNQMELLDSPFDRAAHTVDIRHIDNGRGRHNIPNVGIFLWRLRSFALTRATARAVATVPDGRYTFDPLGASRPLFNRPRTETAPGQFAAEENVPGPVRRRPLYDELEARRQALVDGRTPRGTYFGAQPVLAVAIRTTAVGTFTEVPPEEILVCDLSETGGDWQRPPEKKVYTASGGDVVERPITVAVDPVLGRLAFRDNFTSDIAQLNVEVSWSYGFSGELGGGPYNRQASMKTWLNSFDRLPTWQRGVTRDEDVVDLPSSAGIVKGTLDEAIADWNDYITDTPGLDDPFGLITIMDSRTYPEPLPEITIPEGGRLVIAAAGWPAMADPDAPGQERRIVGQVVAEDLRPNIEAEIKVQGTAPATSLEPGELILDGLLINGGLSASDGNLGRLRLLHTTLVPASGGLQAPDGNARLMVALDRSICGPISLGELVPDLTIRDSIVDGAGGTAIAAPGAHAAIESCTLFGELTAASLTGSNSIFTGRVDVTRRQIGCVRFSYLPLASHAPRRYRCQPAEATDASLTPQFTASDYGEPGYGQLGSASQTVIRTGADDEGEMGAFHFLQQSSRIANLRSRFAEHLRFGLEAGILFVN